MNNLTLWAKAILAFPNLTFTVIDTTSVENDADVLRLFTMDKYGFTGESLLIHSKRYPGALNTEWTGITADMMERADNISESWPAIGEALAGKFVLAYNLAFVQRHLAENAEHYSLPPLYIIGQDLQQAAKMYFQRTGGFTGVGLSLQDACARIGHIVPPRPNAEARAQAQLALLQAMAQGRTAPLARAPGSTEEGEGLGDLDGHPF